MDPALLARARAGDAAAIAEVVVANRPLVLHVRARYARTLDPEDAIQVGSIGLLRAIAKYDPAKGCWSTVAYWWIRGALEKESRSDHLIRRPFARSYGDGPGVMWTDAPRGEREEGIDLASPHEDPAAIAEAADEWASMETRIRALGERDPRMERIIRGRFGLGGAEPMMMQPLADELGITRERVRQLEVQALNILAGRPTKPRRTYTKRRVESAPPNGGLR